ncbi:TPA: hypothetical protein L9220_003235 [Klebsiella aerogenes]|uniref:hypothetical protein n=1 Tax=Klebsiella aerogenes TaxID=548 RepID=UPI001868015E|nr:hypothetical protein [Klebsiella aerogenes]HBR6954359.1 hypothetical protein [Klebsiella aerogenes]HCB2458529.1 hypothetical protein [Klebsiella aerogenes]
MDEKQIALEAMLAARDSANWSWWTMAATISSVLISLGTLGMAFSALDTWRQQEMLKIKIEFKRSILELYYALESMPSNWSYMEVNRARMRLQASPELANRVGDSAQLYINKMALKEAFNEACKAWIMCEHIFSDTEVETLWRKISSEFRPYLMRGGVSYPLNVLLESLNSRLKVL